MIDNLKDRLVQLRNQQASLQMQLDELAYLIKGYEVTIEEKEKEGKEEEAGLTE